MHEISFFHNATQAGFTVPSMEKSFEYYPNTQCIILNGQRVAKDLTDQCKEIFANKNSLQPSLAVILVGDNPASKIYVQNKINLFEKSNFKSNLILLSKDISENDIFDLISNLNNDNSVHGILVQLPLSKHLDSKKILSSISFHKDVDGFSAQNLGLLALNQIPRATACTPFGIMILLSAYGIHVAGKNCVVVGRSTIVGKPMGLLLLNANATVTFVHTHTKNRKSFTKNADILIVATGKKHLIRSEDIKSGAIVIDVGIHQNENGTLSGDVHPEVSKKAAALSPVPKGVGPMTVACLLLNTALMSQK